MSERDLDDLLLGLRDTANPLDVLAASEARVLDRLDRTLESRPRALRAAFRSARRTVLALVAVGGVATGAAATAAIAIAMPADGPGTIEIVADPANPEKIAFSAVAKSTQKPDKISRVVFEALARSSPGIRAADARGITASDGTQAWVIPGPSRTCFGVEGAGSTGYSCTSNAHAVRGGLSSAEVDDDDAVRAIYLVPDDVTSAEAAGRTFTPHNNLVVVAYPRGSTVIFTTKTGDTTSVRD